MIVMKKIFHYYFITFYEEDDQFRVKMETPNITHDQGFDFEEGYPDGHEEVLGHVLARIARWFTYENFTNFFLKRAFLKKEPVILNFDPKKDKDRIFAPKDY